MKGDLVIVGLGPGPEGWVTPAATAAVAAADVILGYTPYVNRITPKPGQILEASDNREELVRAQRALSLAASGKRVAVVSGGDPGVFAMAAAVYEAVEANPASADGVDIRVEPGVTAMLAAAARIGAPLGHDFCAISLSDNLKPWATIERRLRLVAEADFVIALYNPASKARPQQIKQAFQILSAVLPAETIVVFARAVGRPDEEIDVATLAGAADMPCDMRTLVIIGSQATRQVKSPDGRAWIYTPRSEQRR
ncbi:precorrin-3B C(17)-methyltransferase [Hyphomicrobium facile]|uniref:Precorrin-3 methyltransferase n=1 Tax=Hyphomicrobium facile TaxID=51670 RepID=A0A1I7MVX5_9HYPH|nr:precorrin-3B C(17)-methyltransferase [Hyphomicrobium facile]SFV26563.1 precorrin-3 methyltransferase [Hyphomicrobium facile]